jgi:hypothetical protein
LGVLGFAVFEVLGFIPDHAKERNPLEEVEVPHEGPVGGDDEVGFSQGGRFFVSIGSMVDEDGKIGTEPLGFPSPVLEQGGGAYHEGGLGKALFHSQGGQEAKGLKGFAQSHFVCEDATESVAEEVKEPGHAGFLVRPQDGVKGFVEAWGRQGG